MRTYDAVSRPRSASNVCVAEPEEEEQAAGSEEAEEKKKEAQQGDTTGSQESMQIEEVSQQEGQQGNDSSSQQNDTGGVVGAMMGAAKSLFGGSKPDEKVCLLHLSCRVKFTSITPAALQESMCHEREESCACFAVYDQDTRVSLDCSRDIDPQVWSLTDSA